MSLESLDLERLTADRDELRLEPDEPFRTMVDRITKSNIERKKKIDR